MSCLSIKELRLDYGDMTSDVGDGPHCRKERRKAKRLAAKRRRRQGKQRIKEGLE